MRLLETLLGLDRPLHGNHERFFLTFPCFYLVVSWEHFEKICTLQTCRSLNMHSYLLPGMVQITHGHCLHIGCLLFSN